MVSYEGRPSPAQITRMENLESEIGDVEKKFADFVAKDVAAANALLSKAKLDTLKVATKEEWKNKDQAPAAGGTTRLDEEQVEELARTAPWIKSMIASFRIEL